MADAHTQKTAGNWGKASVLLLAGKDSQSFLIPIVSSQSRKARQEVGTVSVLPKSPFLQGLCVKRS